MSVMSSHKSVWLIPSLLPLGIFLFFFVPLNFFLWCFFWGLMFAIFIKFESDIFSPLWIYFLYFLTYFGIRPAYHLLYEKEVNLFNLNYPHDDVYALTLLFTSLSLLPFLAGYAVKPSSMRIVKNNSYSSILMVFIAFSVQVSVIIAALYLIYHFGGINNVIQIQSALVQLIPQSQLDIKLAWIFILISFLPISLLLARYGFSKTVFLFFIINFLFCLIFGRRLALLGLIVPLGVYYHYYKKRVTVGKGIFLFVGVVIFFIAVVFFRIETSSNQGISIIEESAEFYSWDMNISNILHFGDLVESRKFLDFIPYWLRDILGNDAFVSFKSLGEALVEIHIPHFPAGIPPGLTGMFFLQFGFPSLIIFCFFTGILARRIHIHFQHRLNDRLYLMCLYPLILTAFLYIVRAGDLWVFFNSYWRIFFLTLVIIYLCRKLRVKSNL